MKKLLILFLTIASLYGYAQVPSLNDIVRTNTLSPSKVSNALDGSKSFTATGTDTYAITTNLGQYSGILTYAVGDMYTVTFTNANTSTTVTLNVDGEGVVSIKDNAGDDLAIGDLKAGGTYKVRFNGTNFRIIGATGSGGLTPPIDATDIADGSVTDTEFQYINSLTSNAQTQIDGKQDEFTSQSAALVYASPGGTSGVPAFLSLTAEHLATLTTSRTLTSASALVQTDNLRKVYVNSASPFNLTADLLATGTEVTIINIGSATVTLVAGSGVTLPGGTVAIAAGSNAVIIYRIPATPDVYTGSASSGDVTFAYLMTSRTMTSADDLDQTDNFRIVYANSASPFNITADLLTVGSQVTIWNKGSATVTLIAGSGVTLSSVPIATNEIAVIFYDPAATPSVRLSSGAGGSVTSIATTSPITGGTITSTGTIGIDNAAADGSTKGAATFTAADFNASSGLISLDYTNAQAASGSNKGFLTSSDWTTFNGKQSSITFGTGVQTALGVNIGSSGAPVLFNGAGGTPSSISLTNGSGLPVTGLSGSWTNLTSTLTGTSPFMPLTGTGTLTGALTIAGTSSNTLKTTFTSLGTTQTDGAGLWLSNTTAAAAGAQQRSPAITLEGQGWKTNATAASQSVKFILDVLPVEGTTAPTGNIVIGSSVNGNAYSNLINIGSSGSITVVQASSGINTNNISSNGSSLGLNLSYGTNVTNTGLRLAANANSTIIAGNTGAINVLSSNNFAPTSGNANFYGLQLNHVIDQKGSSSGEVNDIEIIPTVTSVLGIHRAIKSTSGGLLMNGVTSPSQITSNQNDYTYTGLNQSFVQRLNSDASRDLTGLVAGAAGEMKSLMNVGSFNIVLKNEDAGSTAANRFAIGSDFTMVPGGSALIWYDGTSSRWRIMSKN